MNTRTWWAMSRRVLVQLLADKRTIGPTMAALPLLLTLLYYMYSEMSLIPGSQSLFSGIALTMFAILLMSSVFLIASIITQRERVSGALERPWMMNLHYADLLFEYPSASIVVAVIQAVILCTADYCFLGV